MNDKSLKLVREIEKKNEKLYGEIQPCCKLYKDYCRCSAETRASAQDRTTE